MRLATELPATSMAFQPTVEVGNSTVWGYEALVRGAAGASAKTVFSKVKVRQAQEFDEACRLSAIECAGALWTPPNSKYVSINVSPRHLLAAPASVSQLETAVRESGLAPEIVMIELTEVDRISKLDDLTAIAKALKKAGFKTAIDDFGSGHSGLLRLVALPVDYVKLEMGLVRDIDTSAAKQRILEGVLQILRNLHCNVIAKGVGSAQEAGALKAHGVRLQQGFHFANPEIKSLPNVCFGRTSKCIASVCDDAVKQRPV